MTNSPGNKRIEALAGSLTDRQRTYLLTTYDMDQAREANMKGFGFKVGFKAPPASVWRWMEYGPVGAKGTLWDGELRTALDRLKLVSSGTGAVWASLRQKGLIETELRPTAFVNAFSKKPLPSLWVKMTTDGRKVSRVLKGEPVTKPKEPPKPLSLSALRLIEYGQAHPDKVFYWNAPWDDSGFTADYMVMLSVAKSLIKKDLLQGDAPHRLQITRAGMALDVKSQPNWKPRNTKPE